MKIFSGYVIQTVAFGQNTFHIPSWTHTRNLQNKFVEMINNNYQVRFFCHMNNSLQSFQAYGVSKTCKHCFENPSALPDILEVWMSFSNLLEIKTELDLEDDFWCILANSKVKKLAEEKQETYSHWFSISVNKENIDVIFQWACSIFVILGKYMSAGVVGWNTL